MHVKIMKSVIKCFVLAALVVSFSVSAQAATLTGTNGTCTIISSTTATIIANSGFYCLNANSTATLPNLASGIFITINASNVVLDLNGYTIKNVYANSTADGIGTTGTATNVTIRNGKLIGFNRGINIRTGSDHLVEKMKIDSIDHGVDVRGKNSIIRSNMITSPGGPVVACESDVRVLNNEIVSSAASISGLDACMGSTPRLIIEANTFSNTVGGSVAVHCDDCLVINNRIVNWGTGIAADGSLACTYRDNVFILTNGGVQTDTCVSVGNNN